MELGQLIEKVGECFIYIVLASILVERGLQTVYNWSLFADNLEGKGVKGPLAFLVSLAFVVGSKLDIVSYIYQGEGYIAQGVGYFITALLIAAGSKAASATWGDIKKMNGTNTEEPQV